MKQTKLYLVLAATTCLLACTSPETTLQPAAKSTSVQCHYGGARNLPDPKCTPGKADPRVTPQNIQQTICMPGYASRVRNEKPASYFTDLKRKQMLAYGDTDSPSWYEEDHLISLELGGSNDPENLWPEPGASPNAKDKVEDQLHALVCSGKMDLREAQRRIVTDWTVAVP